MVFQSNLFKIEILLCWINDGTTNSSTLQQKLIEQCRAILRVPLLPSQRQLIVRSLIARSVLTLESQSPSIPAIGLDLYQTVMVILL